jgi:hypothetical protein
MSNFVEGLEVGEIYTLKMNSGEEMVAKVLGVSDGSVCLGNPLSIAPGPQGLGLMPSMFTADSDKKVTLNTMSISMFAPTVEQIRSKYIESTTGIATTSKKILVG